MTLANLWWTRQRANRPWCSSRTWSTAPRRRTCRQPRPARKRRSDGDVRKTCDRPRVNGKNGNFVYFDKHLEREHHGEYVIGRAQKPPLVAVRRNVRSFHGQRDAVQRYERQHGVVEPFLFDELAARSPETWLRTHNARGQYDTLYRVTRKRERDYATTRFRPFRVCTERGVRFQRVADANGARVQKMAEGEWGAGGVKPRFSTRNFAAAANALAQRIALASACGTKASRIAKTSL